MKQPEVVDAMQKLKEQIDSKQNGIWTTTQLDNLIETFIKIYS